MGPTPVRLSTSNLLQAPPVCQPAAFASARQRDTLRIPHHPCELGPKHLAVDYSSGSLTSKSIEARTAFHEHGRSSARTTALTTIGSTVMLPGQRTSGTLPVRSQLDRHEWRWERGPSSVSPSARVGDRDALDVVKQLSGNATSRSGLECICRAS